MLKAPIAVGGIGGSGTRIIAGFLQDLGVFIGSDLPASNDTIWYAALFGRRDVLLDDPAQLSDLITLFADQMENPTPLTPDQHNLLQDLRAQSRHQHVPETLHAWMDSFIAHTQTKDSHPLWGWKVPYTHVLIDKLMPALPQLKYIHITRNGLEMAYSRNQNQLGKWGPVFLGRNVTIGPRDSLSYWCAVHRRMSWLTKQFPDRIFHLDYNRLVADPAGHLSEMFAFLDADVSPDQLATWAATIHPPDSIGRHLSEDMSVFDPSDLAYVNAQAETATSREPVMTNASLSLEQDIAHSKTLNPGGDHYRAYVGPPDQYDFMGATQFCLLNRLGLQEDHRLVDIGCGSLRAGRYLINFLLPGHYTGIEPNSWLWQKALEQEIGADVAELKKPRFLAEDDFSLSEIAPASVDFIVAQSIYSHTAADLLERSAASAARSLTETGHFLFTVVTPDDAYAGGMASGYEASGWVYPKCVTFTEEQARSICAAAGLHCQRLDWFHPRQTWFRAVRDESRLLTPEMHASLGTGKPLFDPRFK